MKKRIICICMAALMSLSLLAGCGAEGNTDTEQDAAAQTVTDSHIRTRISAPYILRFADTWGAIIVSPSPF